MPLLKRYLDSLESEVRQGIEVLALGLDVEYELEKLPIPFRSARNLRSMTSFDRMVYATKLSEQIMFDGVLSFFSHKDIALPALYHGRLQWYVVLLTYYVDIFANLIEENKTLRRVISIQPVVTVSPFADIAADLEACVMPDTLKFVCAERNIECVLIGDRVAEKSEYLKMSWFVAKRKVFGFFLFFANLLQSFRPARRMKVLASDNWGNISYLLEALPESELVLLDRTQGLKAGVRGWWRHKIQFKQLGYYDSRRIRKIAQERKHFFEESFVNAKSRLRALEDASFRGYAIGKLVEPVLRRILSNGGAEGVAAIEHTYKMLGTLRPDVIMVRASASGQIHFLTLCLVGKKLGIPSLEIQHGQLYADEGSLSRRRTAEYIAVYGSAVRAEMKKAGYTDDKIIDAGSPRFDVYRPTPLVQKKDLQVTCIAPSIFQGFFDDSYDVTEYFEAVAAALADFPVKLAIKLKPGTGEGFSEEMLKKIFGKRAYEVHRDTPIRTLFADTDIVISPMTTVLYESLIMGKPTIFVAYSKAHYRVGAEFVAYADAGLFVARTKQEVKEKVELLARSYDERVRLGQGAERCIATHYSFDGHSTKRIVDAIRALVKK